MVTPKQFLDAPVIVCNSELPQSLTFFDSHVDNRKTNIGQWKISIGQWKTYVEQWKADIGQRINAIGQ